MNSRQRSPDGRILPLTAAFVWLADQAGKSLVVSRFVLGQPWEPFPPPFPFRLTYTTNTGAAFGLFPGLSDLFTIIALVVIVAILFYQRRLPEEDWQVRFAMGLQLGGALGNLTDRLMRGSVVDFIDLTFWPLQNWPIFNLADAAIVSGTLLLALLIVQEARCGSRQNGSPSGGEERRPCHPAGKGPEAGTPSADAM